MNANLWFSLFHVLQTPILLEHLFLNSQTVELSQRTSVLERKSDYLGKQNRDVLTH